MTLGKKYYSSIDIIKCIGALLVLNSHMDTIYPIASLATGGALGNGLFFFASGFVGTKISSDARFVPWYLKRVKRLVPITSIAAIIRLLVIKASLSGFLAYFSQIVWPTYFWFTGAILLFDIPYFFILRNGWMSHFKAICAGLVFIYILYYVLLLDTSSWVVESIGMMSVKGCFKLIYYFLIMLIGAFTKEHANISEERKSKYLVSGIVSFILMYVFKIIISKKQILMHFQFGVQILTLITVVSVSYFFLAEEKFFVANQKTFFYKVAKEISKITLELYLAQQIVVQFAKKLSFPLNFFVMVSGSFILAVLFHFVAEKTYDFLSFSNKKNKKNENNYLEEKIK